METSGCRAGDEKKEKELLEFAKENNYEILKKTTTSLMDRILTRENQSIEEYEREGGLL